MTSYRFTLGILGFLGLLGFSGCVETTYEWKKEGGTPQDMKADKAGCEFEAESANGSPFILNAEQKEARKERVKKMFKLCMTSRGYKLEEVPVEP